MTKEEQREFDLISHANKVQAEVLGERDEKIRKLREALEKVSKPEMSKAERNLELLRAERLLLLEQELKTWRDIEMLRSFNRVFVGKNIENKEAISKAIDEVDKENELKLAS